MPLSTWLNEAFWSIVTPALSAPLAAWLGARHWKQQYELEKRKQDREDRRDSYTDERRAAETEALLAEVTDKTTANLIRRLDEELKDCKIQHEKGDKERQQLTIAVDRQAIVIEAMKINIDALVKAIERAGIPMPPLLPLPEGKLTSSGD